jgi:hypothetical protein
MIKATIEVARRTRELQMRQPEFRVLPRVCAPLGGLDVPTRQEEHEDEDEDAPPPYEA